MDELDIYCEFTRFYLNSRNNREMDSVLIEVAKWKRNGIYCYSKQELIELIVDVSYDALTQIAADIEDYNVVIKWLSVFTDIATKAREDYATKYDFLFKKAFRLYSKRHSYTWMTTDFSYTFCSSNHERSQNGIIVSHDSAYRVVKLNFFQGKQVLNITVFPTFTKKIARFIKQEGERSYYQGDDSDFEFEIFYQGQQEISSIIVRRVDKCTEWKYYK